MDKLESGSILQSAAGCQQAKMQSCLAWIRMGYITVKAHKNATYSEPLASVRLAIGMFSSV